MRILASRPMTAVTLLVALCLAPKTSLAGQGGIPLDPAPTFVAFTPASVAADPKDGTLWVGDRYLPRIAHLAHDGSLLAVFPASIYGGGGPVGLTFEGGAGDYLYVSDPDARRVARVDRQGNPFGGIPTDPLGIISPAGLAWDSSDDTLYVADPTVRLILQLQPRDLDQDGLPDSAVVLGSFSTAALGSDNPTGVALDPVTRHLFISDPALDRVFEVALDGSLIVSFVSGPYGGTSVTGLAWVAASGQLLLADAGRRILTVTRAGAPLKALGTAPFGSLSPQGLAWDASSGSYLAVTGERKLLQFQPVDSRGTGKLDGTVQARQGWTSAFGCIAPSGIAIDPATGDRFISDSYQQRVFRVDRSGGLVGTFDTSGFGSLSPTGLAMGPGGGSLFLSDNQAKKIFEVTPSGTLLRSMTTTRFKRKPARLEASNDPRGVAYDPALDHLLIVDYQAAKVFEVTRNGAFVDSFPTAPGASYPTDLTLKLAENRIVVSDSTGSFAEFSRTGVLQSRFPGVPVQVRISGAGGVSVDPDTLQRLVTDPGQDAVFFVSRLGTALGQISLEPYGVVSPSGAVWDAAGPFLYVVDRSMARVDRISPGPDGVFSPGDDSVLTASTSIAGSTLPVGLTLDRGLGRLGWADEQTDRIHWTTETFDYVGSMDLSPAGVTAPRGVDRDPASHALFVGDGTAGILVIGSSGGLLESRSALSLGIGDVGGVGLSSSEGMLLIVDRADRTLMSVATSSLLSP